MTTYEFETQDEQMTITCIVDSIEGNKWIGGLKVDMPDCSKWVQDGEFEMTETVIERNGITHEIDFNEIFKLENEVRTF